MGFGLPSAIGAKVAMPDHIVIDIDGDASFMMTAMELVSWQISILFFSLSLIHKVKGLDCKGFWFSSYLLFFSLINSHLDDSKPVQYWCKSRYIEQ